MNNRSVPQCLADLSKGTDFHPRRPTQPPSTVPYVVGTKSVTRIALTYVLFKSKHRQKKDIAKFSMIKVLITKEMWKENTIPTSFWNAA